MSFYHPLISPILLERVIDGMSVRAEGIHGISHWERVERNGLYLACREGADEVVASLFGLLHDSRRVGDGADVGHGARAARLAEELHSEGILPVDEVQLGLLVAACEGHTDIIHTDDVTVGCCWDADRLDLTRLRMEPDPAMLNTETARGMAAIGDFTPLLRFVLGCQK